MKDLPPANWMRMDFRNNYYNFKNRLTCSHVNKKTSFKVRVDIEQWGTTFGWKSFCTSQSAGIPTSVGCFHEIATNCLKTWAQLAKQCFRLYMRMCFM